MPIPKSFGIRYTDENVSAMGEKMNIKVESTGSAKAVGSTRKSSKTSSSDGVFSSFLEEADDVSSSSSVSAASSVSGLEALLAAQSVGDALQDSGKKRRAAARGNDLLDKLEELRTALLSGEIPKSKLIELAQALRVKREVGLDKELNDILDEIELRAQVELAKLSHNV